MWWPFRSMRRRSDQSISSILIRMGFICGAGAAAAREAQARHHYLEAACYYDDAAVAAILRSSCGGGCEGGGEAQRTVTHHALLAYATCHTLRATRTDTAYPIWLDM